MYSFCLGFSQIFEDHPLLHEYCNDNITDLVIEKNGTHRIGDSYFGQTHYDTHRKNQPNTALLSLILILGTFLIAYFLKVFRNSKFLGRGVSVDQGRYSEGICYLIFFSLITNSKLI